jgi:hypothetical protein
MDDNIAPAVDFLQEVRVQSSMYDAGVGRSGGGNVMLFTRSGEDAYHGSAFYYFQNEALNANEFFLNSEGIDRPVGRRNEGGFVVGGPVPGLKSKMRFFGGYQKTDAKTSYVPTARTLTQLPTFLGLIKGNRTEQAVLDAVKADSARQGNSAFTAYWTVPNVYNKAPVSPVALSILNLVNPATGNYWIPSPRTMDLTANCNNPYGTYIRGLCDDGTVSNKSEGYISEFKQGIDANFRMAFTQERILHPATFNQTQYISRVDFQVTQQNSIAVNYYFADFPAVDPFTNPSSQASPVGVKKTNRAEVASLSDLHAFGSNFINEVRLGMYSLRNTRQLDDEFLNQKYTNTAVGITNPATFFNTNSASSQLGNSSFDRLAQFTFKNNVSHFSFGATNDAFNKKDLKSYDIADSASWIRGSHHFKFGGEVKRHYYDTNLPEQQGAEFTFDSFFQFLIGRATEATTRFGVSDKHFRMQDIGIYIADDWKLTSKLTLNVGVRWDAFGSPEERNGRLANFIPSRVTDPNNPLSGFVVASNVKPTGFEAIDKSVELTARAATRSTLAGQDLNNIAPRFGFAYSPSSSDNLIIRGGYGVFYDRPSAAFINTIYKNYPFMHQIKIAAPHGMVPIEKAFSLSDPHYPFASYFPYHIDLMAEFTDSPPGKKGIAYRYDLRDATPVTSYVDGRKFNPFLGTTVLPNGNSAVPFEFRAVDPNLRTPYVQQWNLGFEKSFLKSWTLEVRYQGSKGTKLLQASSFNQPYDLNDLHTPDHIFARLNDAYEKAYALAGSKASQYYPGALSNKATWNGTERQRGAGKAFGFSNPITGNAVDYNLSSEAWSSYTHLPDSTYQYPYISYTNNLAYNNVIPLALRSPILGLDYANATMLRSNANSNYNALQMSLTKKFSNGYSFNAGYTWSKSIDTCSSDPGGSPGTTRPDVANSGDIVMGNQRDVSTSRAVSDFDRTHRLTISFTLNLYDLGLHSKWIKGWKLSGSGTVQSGAPYSIYAGNQELTKLIQYYDPNHRELYSKAALNMIDSYLFTDPRHVPDVNPLAKSTGGLYGSLYARPSVGYDDLKALQEMGKSSTRDYFNTALLMPSAGAFGNLGRNVLRAAPQKKLDLGLSKTTHVAGDKAEVQIRLDVMNVFNNVNLAAPIGNMADYYNLGDVLYTIGGPRVMQGSIRLSF